MHEKKIIIWTSDEKGNRHQRHSLVCCDLIRNLGLERVWKNLEGPGKYWRWLLEIKREFVTYFVTEEMKKEKQSVRSGKKPVKIEERIESNELELLNKCWLDKKNDIIHSYNRNRYVCEMIERMRWWMKQELESRDKGIKDLQ